MGNYIQFKSYVNALMKKNNLKINSLLILVFVSVLLPVDFCCSVKEQNKNVNMQQKCEKHADRAKKN